MDIPAMLPYHYQLALAYWARLRTRDYDDRLKASKRLRQARARLYRTMGHSLEEADNPSSHVHAYRARMTKAYNNAAHLPRWIMEANT